MKQLSLDQTIAKYRSLNEEALLKKLFEQAAAGAVPSSGAKLQPETLGEYASSIKVLARALSDPQATGVAQRSGLPSMAELLLRPHGAKICADCIKVCSERRKVCIVASSLVQRAFPELGEADRAAAQAAWNAQLRAARHAYESQKRVLGGYGGSVSDAGITWHKIQAVVSSLLPGDTDRLILRMLTDLKFRGATSHNAPLMNLGHIRVYRPNEQNQTPTQEQMAKWCCDDDQPRGWLFLSKNAKQDTIHLVVGYQNDGSGGVAVLKQTMRVPVGLGQELRTYLAGRPPALKYLFTDSRHSANVADSQPYVGLQGRSSWQARVNRLLMSYFGVRARQFRVDVAMHHMEQAKRELLQTEGTSGSEADESGDH